MEIEVVIALLITGRYNPTNLDLQSILSPRRIGTFYYYSQYYQYYLTDTGLLESYYYGGSVHPIAYVPIAKQNGYYDLDTSNYSLEYGMFIN